MSRKHCGKRGKCWFPAFSLFSKMFSKVFFVRVEISRDCALMSYSNASDSVGKKNVEMQNFFIYNHLFLSSKISVSIDMSC